MALFAIGYGLAVVAPIASGFDARSRWLAVPVGGPWIAMARGDSDNAEGLVFDGILQFAGAALASGAFIYPERVLGTPREAAALHVDATRRVVFTGHF